MQKKKIVILFGGYRKKETLAAVNRFIGELRKRIEADCEMIMLKDMNIGQCRGCFNCLTNGEECCPHDDDREMIVEKMRTADGVIFATPNYALQVTAVLKNFLDRIAYTFHRPCFFGIKAMGIVTQGAIGAGGILRYFKSVMQFTGFDHLPGLALTTVTPRTAMEQRLIDRKTAQAAMRYAAALMDKKKQVPGMVQFLSFRFVRSMYRAVPDDSLKDVRYFRDNGWFTSPYYYQVNLLPHLRILGKLVDAYGMRFVLGRQKAISA